jgi:NAD(P)-dependent dehydrogenase (short-subunit alcohol dehydrogenase family)
MAAEAVGAGADVVLAARRGAALAEVVAEAGGGTVVVADITRPGDVARLVDEASAAGPLDLVVLTVGAGHLVRMADASAGDWAALLAANVTALNGVVAGVLGALAPSAIVGVLSSETVGRPRLGLGLYGAAKAALNQSVLSWQVEHPEVRFCRVTVGATMPTGFGDAFDGTLLGEALEHWAARGEMQRRFMPSEQVARVILGVLATGLANPDVNLETLRLRSPSDRVASLDEVEFG